MKRSKKLPTTCFIFRLRRKSCHPYWRSCHYSFLPITSQFAVGVMWISPGIWQSRSRWSDSRLFSVVLNHSTVTDFAKFRSEEHTSELQSLTNIVCRLLLEKKN